MIAPTMCNEWNGGSDKCELVKRSPSRHGMQASSLTSAHGISSVSYTHLTLPTILRV